MSQPLPDWYTYHAVDCERAAPVVDPRRLTAAQRHQLSNGLKRANPAKAEMLRNDPVIAQIKAAFNARIVFDQSEFNSLMKQGEEQ